jgi:polysaccharide deacetylase 2 family uncharacterized protein YibQ
LSQILKDIERPLGQTLRPRRSLIGSGALRRLVLAAGALAVVAAAGAIALREKPFRTPVTEVETTPDVASAPPPAAAPAVKTEPAAGALQQSGSKSDGPKIIQVNPDAAKKPSGTIVIQDANAAGQDLRVAHLPDRALLEDSPVGPLPVRAADGRRPVDVYARPWSGARGARIAIVLGGFAISQTGTNDAIERLPGEVTIAFSPQGNSIGRWMQAARRKGHEIIMQVPLEPFDYPNVDPGRNTLTVDASAEENLDRLHWTMARTTNYTGVMNFMGARYSSDRAAMQTLMADLGKRGLLYLDDGSSARTTAPDMALKNGVPFAAADSVIDGERDRGAILKKLDELERTARAKGTAIGTGSAFGETVEAVSTWIAEAKKRGIEIVPISALTLDPERS